MKTTPFEDNATPVEAELYQALRALLPSTSTVWVEMTDESDGNGLPGNRLPAFGVWVDDDLIGAGECPSEALESAIRSARAWR